MRGFSQTLLLAVAALGILVFIIFAQTAPFQNLFGTLYPKPASEARGPQKTSTNLSLWQDGVQIASALGGSIVEVRGLGFQAGETVYVGLRGYFGMTPVTADSSGKFSLPWVAPQASGTYTFDALALRRKTWTVVASTNLTVTN